MLKVIIKLLLFTSFLSLTIMLGGAFIEKARAIETAYIKANGSVEPQTASIFSNDNITYSLTRDFNGFIVVERDNIIVDGAGYAVQGVGKGRGIDLTNVDNVTIKNLTVENYEFGIVLTGSQYVNVYGNTIKDNTWFGVGFSACELTPRINSNTVVHNNISGSKYGLWFCHSSHILISENNIENCVENGAWIEFSTNVTFSRNTIAHNPTGIELTYSSNNKFHHNTFVNNTRQVFALNSTNSWDNGYLSGGNYWSDYIGIDLNADGIGDTQHTIDSRNVDNFPLAGMFSSFPVSSGHQVEVISNSSIEGYSYFSSNNTIAIRVSNRTGDQARGFIRLTIPHDLMLPPYNITVNNNPLSYSTIWENEAQSMIYFNFEPHVFEIVIIPEHPSILVIYLIMFSALIVVIIGRSVCFKNKR